MSSASESSFEDGRFASKSDRSSSDVLNAPSASSPANIAPTWNSSTAIVAPIRTAALMAGIARQPVDMEAQIRPSLCAVQPGRVAPKRKRRDRASLKPLIVAAIRHAEGRQCTVDDIYRYVEANSDDYGPHTSPTKKWKKNVRYILSIKKDIFVHTDVENPDGRGKYWTVHDDLVVRDDGTMYRSGVRRLQPLPVSRHHPSNTMASSISRLITFCCDPAPDNISFNSSAPSTFSLPRPPSMYTLPQHSSSQAPVVHHVTSPTYTEDRPARCNEEPLWDWYIPTIEDDLAHFVGYRTPLTSSADGRCPSVSTNPCVEAPEPWCDLDRGTGSRPDHRRTSQHLSRLAIDAQHPPSYFGDLVQMSGEPRNDDTNSSGSGGNSSENSRQVALLSTTNFANEMYSDQLVHRQFERFWRLHRPY